MKDKSLRDKAIDIKGKAYVQVADRIIYFNENYPSGYIQTKILSDLDAERVVIRATVTIEETEVTGSPSMGKTSTTRSRSFVAHSQAMWGDGFINKTSAIENCETSAVGRALALMGIGVIDSVASVDEIEKAHIAEEQGRMRTAPDAIKELGELLKAKGIEDADDIRRAISILSNGEALNTSGIARIRKEITLASPDTLRAVIE